MSFRCHFVSFGAGRRGYGSALKRLKKEIKRLDPDAQVWLFDERKVNQDIGGLDQSFSDFARDNPRGYGLWVWKPWAVLEVMKSVQQGDIVFYLDAGCTVHTSPKSKLRYQWYINHIREHENLFFGLPQAEFNYTKKEAIEHFQLSEQEVNSGQLVATIQGHLVSEKQLKFVKDWLYACTLDSGRLLKDVGVLQIEDERFIDHRHDQSVLSCLAKSKGITTLPDESFHHPKWNRDGVNFPFWTTRKISGLPRWMGYYAPRAWPFVVKSQLTRKPITKLVDPEYLANL
jgi:hypothetical protein